MKLKLQKLVDMIPSLQKLVNKDLPIKVSFALGKMVKQLNDEYEVFEKNRTKLFKKYGEELEDNKMQIKDENIDAFQKEIQELLNIEVNVDIQPIKLKQLGNIKISPLDLNNLDVLIQE